MMKQKISENQKQVKEKKVIDKIILWRNESEIETLKNKLNEILPFAERLIQSYNKLPFANDKAGFYDILANSSENAKTHLRNTLPDKLDVAGVSLNRAKVLQMGLVEIAEMTEFNKVLAEFNTAEGMNYHSYFKHSEKAVIIDPLVWDRFVNLHTISADSPEEIELYNKWLHFLTNINEFATYMKKNHSIMLLPVPLGPVIVGLIARLNSDNQLIINKDAFAMITKKIKNKIN